MKHRFFFLITIAMSLFILVACGNQLEGNDFTKMTIYKNGDQDGPYVITEKKVINTFIKKIQSSPKEDVSKIVFEQGPDGRIVFEGKKTVYEVKVFSIGGNVVTDQHYIKAEFDLDQFFTKE
jgi:hypothetical protein